MISIGKLRSPDYYLREVVDGEDYYLVPGEAPGRWTGGGAALLGLSGVVDDNDLAAVFVGRNPRTDAPLTETGARLAGFDLTFSPAKSVSLLWGLSGEGDARRVVACLERAVGEVERYLEREGCRVRRGHAGRLSEPAGGFVAAAFLHRTSRLADPGLHVHYLVMNAAMGSDGRWTALDGRALYQQRYTADAVFQAALRHELVREFGVLFGEADRHGVAEIAGIDRKTRRAFSRRRIEIEAEMTRRGVTSGRAARVATLATRKPKSVAIPEEELRRAWSARAREVGFTLDQVPRMPRATALVVTDEQLAVTLTEQHAAFGRAEVVRAVAASQGATLAQIDARVDTFLASEQAVVIDDGRWWTTPEILRLEQQTIRTARQGRPHRRQGDIGAVALIGPSRSGKTRAAVAGIDAWRGPAILSSVKTDLLAATIAVRSARGEIKVFAPSGVTGLDSASWTPLRRAKTLQGAQAAAKALADASPRGEHDDGAYWLNQAEILLAALLWLAAHSDGRTIADVVDWVLGQDRPTEEASGTVAPLVRALADSADPAVAGPARQVHTWLRGLWEMDPRTSSSIYATARTAIWPWADPGVAALSGCSHIDLDWLLSGENTLYVCAPLEDQDRLAPVLGGLIGDLVNQGFERAIRDRHPVDPTLLVVLDEAANTPLRKLPEWASTVAGVGIQLVTVWQSKSQLDFIYGRQAETILTNHLTKLFFAGMSDPAGLDYATRLLGHEHVPGVLGDQVARYPDHGYQRPAPAQVPLAPANVLRQMQPGEGLLVHGTLPPAHVSTVLSNARLGHRARGKGAKS